MLPGEKEVPAPKEPKAEKARDLANDLAFGILSLRARAERDEGRKALEEKTDMLLMFD